MRQITASFIFSLLANLAWAQTVIPPPIVFGEFPKDDITMMTYEPDTTAAAVVLCHFGTVEQSDRIYKYKYKFHKRIKLLKRTGFDYANINIPYKHLWGMEIMENVKAQVRLPSGSIVKLKNKELQDEKLDDVWSVLKFTFPKLEPGCIIEYQYELDAFELGTIKPWYFQEEIPVRYSEFRIELPKTYQYTYFLQGVNDMVKTEETQHQIIYDGNGKRCAILSNRFIFKNVPAFKPEALIASVNDCLVKIKFQLSELQFAFRSYGVNNTWQEFRKRLGEMRWFGEQYDSLKNTTLAAKEIMPMINGAAKSRERAESYYRYIVNNMRWNHSYSFSMERLAPLDSVYQQRQGSSGELNLLLLALLRRDSFEAYPILVSTRTHGRPYLNFPIMDQFDHMMVQVVVDSTVIIMDALDPLRPPNYPDMEALNGHGLLVKADTTLWIPIMPPSDATDYYKFDMILDGNGHLAGSLIAIYRGYNAILERKRYKSNDTDDSWDKRMLKEYAGFELDTLRHSDITSPTILFNDTLNFKISDAAQVGGDFLYLSPILYSNFDKNMFIEESRKYPIDFGMPYLEQYILNLKLPEGYVVESLPKSSKIMLESNGGSYTFTIEQNGTDELRINSRLQIKKVVFQPEEYPDLKKMMAMVAARMEEQIVLKKKE